jgi:hypothetical protein
MVSPRLAQALAGAVDEVVFLGHDPYKKTRRNLDCARLPARSSPGTIHASTKRSAAGAARSGRR